MLEIKENQELYIESLLSYRGKIKQSCLENVGKEMEKYIQSVGAKWIGNPIIATYSVEGDVVDVELLVPVDRYIESYGEFVFKKQLKIVNAVVAQYKGNPVGLQSVCNQLYQYILEHKMQPITAGYNVTLKTNIMDLENTEINVYVGINPNIL